MTDAPTPGQPVAADPPGRDRVKPSPNEQGSSFDPEVAQGTEQEIADVDIPGPRASERYDPARDREEKRGQIAIYLVWLLCALTGGSLIYGMICAAYGRTADLDWLKAILEIVLAPVVALVGAVTGFYFGEKSR